MYADAHANEKLVTCSGAGTGGRGEGRNRALCQVGGGENMVFIFDILHKHIKMWTVMRVELNAN